jgi:hypothetical protein
MLRHTEIFGGVSRDLHGGELVGDLHGEKLNGVEELTTDLLKEVFDGDDLDGAGKGRSDWAERRR